MNNIIMKNLADDFVKAVCEYKKAQEDQEMLSESTLEVIKRRMSLHDSKNYVKLTRSKYWQDIIQSKIEVIGAIGGNNLMKEFCEYLEEYEEKYCDKKLNLVSCFDSNANGICGWFN